MRNLKTSNKFLRHSLSMPFITVLIIPIVIMDIFTEIYHRICFPLYGLPCIKRRRYIQIDRHKLKYLTFFQKIYCVYCGYANGVINYWVKIAAETEHYWCGIKHKENPDFIEPEHHKDFAKYGDEEDFNRKYKK
jgi:hypothetical protein